MSRLLPLTFALLFTGFAGLRAQSFDPAPLDSFLTQLHVKNGSMGSLAIIRDGEVLYTGTMGQAVLPQGDSIRGQSATPDTRYRIGSITKTLTAAMIMQLVEEGKITLTAKLADYFPDVAKADSITIAQMLRHRSGIVDVTLKLAFAKAGDTATRAEILTMIEDGEPAFSPGSQFSYCNSNYILLGWIVEDLTGQPYAEALATRITAPLGLMHTDFGRNTDPALGDALSYSSGNAVFEPTDMSWPGGAGAITSTATEVATFFGALEQGKVVSTASRDEMIEMEDEYGFALYPLELGGANGFGHNGGIDAFRSLAGYFPAENVAVAYLGNGVITNQDDIVAAAVQAVRGEVPEVPGSNLVKDTPDAATLAEYVGTFSGGGFPLEMVFTTDDTALFLQATGQPLVPLEAYTGGIFRYELADAQMVFTSSGDSLTFTQAGVSFTLARDTSAVAEESISPSAKELERYVGTYAADDFPLDLTITTDGSTLSAQATGQGAIPLTAFPEHTFRFDPAGIELGFDPEAGTVVLRQGGGEFLLAR